MKCGIDSTTITDEHAKRFLVARNLLPKGTPVTGGSNRNVSQAVKVDWLNFGDGSVGALMCIVEDSSMSDEDMVTVEADFVHPTFGKMAHVVAMKSKAANANYLNFFFDLCLKEIEERRDRLRRAGLLATFSEYAQFLLDGEPLQLGRSLVPHWEARWETKKTLLVKVGAGATFAGNTHDKGCFHRLMKQRAKDVDYQKAQPWRNLYVRDKLLKIYTRNPGAKRLDQVTSIINALAEGLPAIMTRQNILNAYAETGQLNNDFMQVAKAFHLQGTEPRLVQLQAKMMTAAELMYYQSYLTGDQCVELGCTRNTLEQQDYDKSVTPRHKRPLHQQRACVLTTPSAIRCILPRDTT